MPRFAANLTMLYNEEPFLERFSQARLSGFSAVEFLFPYDFAKKEVEETLLQNNLELVLFNLPAGNWSSGDRGIAADPRRISEFREGAHLAAEWAKDLHCSRLNCLAGKQVLHASTAEQHETLVENVRYAADVLAKADLNLMVEMINTFDIPGFFVSHTSDAVHLLDEVDRPNVYLQYDIYHMQRMEGELFNTIKKNLTRIGHIQLADNPGRHQPGTGEINYPFLLKAIDELGYEGFVSFEYIPDGPTPLSLGWVEQYGYRL